MNLKLATLVLLNLQYICGRPHEKGPYGRYGVTNGATYPDEVPTF